MATNAATYFKEYRERLGFSSQGKAKDFLAAKDLVPGIDYQYIDALNARLESIVFKLNSVVNETARREDLDEFINKSLLQPYLIIKDAGLIPRLNNQGRRPEEVLFSWLRGFVATEYFTPAISRLLSVEIGSLSHIGDDDLRNIETFKRTPKADIEVAIDGRTIRLEVQSGFQGVNDVKEHKVREAKRLFDAQGTATICLHFDIYNAQAAFIRLDTIEDNDVNWVTRQQMEGQSVFAIEQNFFKWRFLDPVPQADLLEIG